jgi:hypothetical protein
VLARFDDELAVGTQLTLIVAQCGLVERPYGQVAINVAQVAQTQLFEIGADSARGLFGEGKNDGTLLRGCGL